MKNIRKIAALATVFALVTVMMIGCRNEKKLAEKFEIPKLGSEKAAALESGEIMVYETFKTENDIEERLYSTITETYIKFINQGELLFDFTESKKTVETDNIDQLEATNDTDGIIVSRNGIVVSSDEAPDIFSYIKIDYDISDVENIVVADTGNGTTLYAVTMTGAHADKFDYTEDGLESDCTKVVHNYYVDTAGVTRNILSEYTNTVRYNGESQTTVRFIQTTIN